MTRRRTIHQIFDHTQNLGTSIEGLAATGEFAQFGIDVSEALGDGYEAAYGAAVLAEALAQMTRGFVCHPMFDEQPPELLFTKYTRMMCSLLHTVMQCPAMEMAREYEKDHGMWPC